MCKFTNGWSTCDEVNVKGSEYCKEHSQVKCAVCGEQATHSCGEMTQLTCGVHLCDKRECELLHHCVI